MKTHRSPLALSLITLAVSSAINPVALADDEAKPEKSQSIEVITIIGEKTPRSLKDTASSVSVISEEDLKNGQFSSLSNVVAEVPNVVVLTGSAPDIRGVSGNGGATGFNSFSGGAKARVSTLVDGVVEPFVADLTGDTGIWDVQQIEVFRGPQSTNNGRNSIGGAVYVKTADPTFHWESAARQAYRNEDQYLDSALMLSGPLIDESLAFRVTGQYLTADTLTNGVVYDTHEPHYDLDEIETHRVRTKLLWQPEALPGFDALLSYVTSREQGNTGRRYYTATKPTDYVPITQRDMDTEADTFSLKLAYQLNDGMALEVLTYHMDYEWGFDSYDATPEAEQQVHMDETNKSIDAKLSFGLDSAVLNGFIGAAYYEREQKYNSVGSFAYGGEDESDSKSLYGEVSYTLFDDVTVTVGGRIERESQYRDFMMDNRGVSVASKLDQSNTIKLPKFVIQYDVTDETTVALSARRGYNAAGGAFSFTSNEYYYYDEETVNTYEASIRSSFNDGDFNLSGNLFFNNYDGFQALSSSRVITNMNDVETYGIELEAVALVTDDLQFNAGLGWLKTEITDAGVDYPEVDGNELNSAPSISANIGAKYWLNNNLKVTASVRYVDEYYGDFANTEERIAGDYTIARFTADYEYENWLISIFVNNAFDEDAFTLREPVSPRNPEGYVAMEDPRNIGGSVTYIF